jgi:hypothetical protein
MESHRIPGAKSVHPFSRIGRAKHVDRRLGSPRANADAQSHGRRGSSLDCHEVCWLFLISCPVFARGCASRYQVEVDGMQAVISLFLYVSGFEESALRVNRFV